MVVFQHFGKVLPLVVEVLFEHLASSPINISELILPTRLFFPVKVSVGKKRFIYLSQYGWRHALVISNWNTLLVRNPFSRFDSRNHHHGISTTYFNSPSLFLPYNFSTIRFWILPNNHPPRDKILWTFSRARISNVLDSIKCGASRPAIVVEAAGKRAFFPEFFNGILLQFQLALPSTICSIQTIFYSLCQVALNRYHRTLEDFWEASSAKIKRYFARAFALGDSDFLGVTQMFYPLFCLQVIVNNLAVPTALPIYFGNWIAGKLTEPLGLKWWRISAVLIYAWFGLKEARILFPLQFSCNSCNE